MLKQANYYSNIMPLHMFAIL